MHTRVYVLKVRHAFLLAGITENQLTNGRIRLTGGKAGTLIKVEWVRKMRFSFVRNCLDPDI